MPNIKNHLFAIFILLNIPAFAATSLATHTEKRLIKAMTCQHESPTDLFREIASNPEAALTISNNHKSGYDEKISIRTSKPLLLHGAQSDTVHLSFANSIQNFNAVVYSIFKGDPQSVIKALKLGKNNSATRIADYTSQSSSTDCPATVGLTVINKSTFALGCGWCNGD